MTTTLIIIGMILAAIVIGAVMLGAKRNESVTEAIQHGIDIGYAAGFADATEQVKRGHLEILDGLGFQRPTEPHSGG